MSKKKDKAKRKSEAHKRAAAEKKAAELGPIEEAEWVEVTETTKVKVDKVKKPKKDKDAKLAKEGKKDKGKKKDHAPKKGGKQAGAPAKPSLFARLKGYLQGVMTELHRVVWPSRQEVLNSTIIVLFTLIFFGIFAFIVDWLSTGLMDFIIGLAAR
ncbi:MAG: preprotein translocase subunit SecE [Actinomycetia bacterium]|nr:preprotein translocase subunit SecE [Actinomycetes bacterium]